MLYVALAEAGLIAVCVVSFASILRWHIRQAARREDQLVNQVCHLARNPWAPPPVWDEPVVPGDDNEPVYVFTPEQVEP